MIKNTLSYFFALFIMVDLVPILLGRASKIEFSIHTIVMMVFALAIALRQEKRKVNGE